MRSFPTLMKYVWTLNLKDSQELINRSVYADHKSGSRRFLALKKKQQPSLFGTNGKLCI